VGLKACLGLMKEFKMISVVVPTMNESKYIQPCIDSLAEQTYDKEFEIIALDASNDNTPEMCRNAGWKVVKQQGKGVSGARKEGFDATTGDIIATTDADTKVGKDWLKNIAKAFENEKVVAAYGPVYFMDGNFIFKNFGPMFFTLFLKWNRLIRKDHLAGMNFAVRKSAYKQIGGFREELTTAEDVDLGLRIRKLGKIVYSRKIKVYTSVRRLAAEGLFKFLRHHIANYFRMYPTGKASDDFNPIR